MNAPLRKHAGPGSVGHPDLRVAGDTGAQRAPSRPHVVDGAVRVAFDAGTQ